MDIKGWTISGGGQYETDTSGDWTAAGYRVSVNLDGYFDDSQTLWGRFKASYAASRGKVNDGHRLATTDGMDLSVGLELGLRVFSQGGKSITIFAGHGLGFGIMDVSATDRGTEKWAPDCPSFGEIMEDPSAITCWFKGMDGSYTSQKFLAEVAFDLGPITLTPFFEYSANSVKSGHVLPESFFKTGMSVGLEF